MVQVCVLSYVFAGSQLGDYIYVAHMWLRSPAGPRDSGQRFADAEEMARLVLLCQIGLEH